MGYSSEDGDSIMAILEAIETVYLEADVATITFDNIPSTYQHLRIEYSARTDRASLGYDSAKINFNGDTGSNYSEQYQGVYSGTSVFAGRAASQAYASLYRLSGIDVPAEVYATGVCTIFDYAHANKNKSLQGYGGASNEYFEAISFSGMWDSTAAITSFVLDPVGGSNFIRGSMFSLYGIKSS